MNGPTRRLQRSRTDKWIAGVCGGVAQYLGMNANLVRLVFVALGAATGGSTLLIYPVLWAVLPLEGSEAADPVQENLQEMRQETERALERIRVWGQRTRLWPRR